jgi:hypothetical protein
MGSSAGLRCRNGAETSRQTAARVEEECLQGLTIPVRRFALWERTDY